MADATGAQLMQMSSRRFVQGIRAFAAAIIACLMVQATPLLAETDPLKTPADFAHIDDADARAAAIFTEAAKVFRHARCANCHPAGERPLQTDAGHTHRPAVTRGDDGVGHVAMRCTNCHMTGNRDASGVPGAPNWHMAPASMALSGKTAGEICRQIKDPEKNGNRPAGAMVMHVAFDPLIAWAWTPGGDRSSPPGTHQEFVALIHSWIEAGGACPEN